MRVPASLLVVFSLLPIAGCIGDDGPPKVEDGPGEDVAPFLGYEVADPDVDLEFIEIDAMIESVGVQIHARIAMPEGEGPWPVIAQLTPYTAPGRNVMVEPMVDCVTTPVGQATGCGDTFVNQFVRRGYVFAFGDVRGTGDSTGCLDLRGAKDIEDAWHLTEWLGTQEWSNGFVGFIGASYPGSEAHMAALAGNPHLKAVIPVVASTSFYHYHHNDGVPYNGNHALGGTNAGYTQNAIMPTKNPQNPTYAERYAEEMDCPHKENIVDHGGIDQTGAYYAWWQERNLRGRESTVQVPVLMAQGLSDWNVKPDHIATWYNGLPVQKTLIAGQWPHAYPRDACEAGDDPDINCALDAPYGEWWKYANAFFDTYLKGIDTGMFATDVAWVQDNEETWHRSADWPLLPDEREEKLLHLQGDKTITSETPTGAAELSWFGCPDDQMSYGTALGTVDAEMCARDTRAQAIVFETEPMAEDMIVSGVPLVQLTLKSETDFTHLTVVVNRIDAKGDIVNDARNNPRENYGYLNPTFRNGLESPEAIQPGEPYTVTIDLYPQEDVLKAGEKWRVTIASDDSGRTIESYEPGTNTLLIGPDTVNTLWLPLRPAALQGVRLPEPTS